MRKKTISPAFPLFPLKVYFVSFLHWLIFRSLEWNIWWSLLSVNEAGKVNFSFYRYLVKKQTKDIYLVSSGHKVSHNYQGIILLWKDDSRVKVISWCSSEYSRASYNFSFSTNIYLPFRMMHVIRFFLCCLLRRMAEVLDGLFSTESPNLILNTL